MKHGFLLLWVCLLSSIAFCQSTNATISGGVTDVTGNLILDADVEIANDSTGVIYSARTNNSGMYLVPILPPGHYHVQDVVYLRVSTLRVSWDRRSESAGTRGRLTGRLSSGPALMHRWYC
jgi:hypothetical protein